MAKGESICIGEDSGVSCKNISCWKYHKEDGRGLEEVTLNQDGLTMIAFYCNNISIR